MPVPLTRADPPEDGESIWTDVAGGHMISRYLDCHPLLVAKFSGNYTNKWVFPKKTVPPNHPF